MSPLARSEEPIVCRKCGAVHDDATELDDERAIAVPGDFVLCIACGVVSVIPPSGRGITAQPTGDQYDDFLEDPKAAKGLLGLRIMLAAEKSCHARGGEVMSEPRAERTTPARAGWVEVDDSRTFLVAGVFTESMIGATLGEAPRALVRADLTGKWNHGAEDQPVLIIHPDVAREWGQTLIDGAAAAERDLERYLATGKARE